MPRCMVRLFGFLALRSGRGCFLILCAALQVSLGKAAIGTPALVVGITCFSVAVLLIAASLPCCPLPADPLSKYLLRDEGGGKSGKSSNGRGRASIQRSRSTSRLVRRRRPRTRTTTERGGAGGQHSARVQARPKPGTRHPAARRRCASLAAAAMEARRQTSGATRTHPLGAKLVSVLRQRQSQQRRNLVGNCHLKPLDA